MVGENKRPQDLSAAKKALLELRLKKNLAAKVLRQSRIERRAQFSPVPPSFAQELLWLLDQLNPNLSVYSVPRAMRVEGPLDVGALRRTLDTIVARHEVIRTVYEVIDGKPMQVIRPPSPIEFEEIDLSGAVGKVRDDGVQRLLTQAARRPFNLAQDQLMRALLIRLGPEEHVFYLGSHHIASDGWSKGILFAEMKALYAACLAGQAPSLPELPIQYADFALWQRQTLAQPTMEQHLAYWKQQLAGAPPLLKLPTDRPRPPAQTFRGAGLRKRLSRELLDRLKALGKQDDATLFMTLLTAFDVLLARYSGQTDIVLGTPISGRNLPEIEPLIGYFTNTLALRTDLSGNPTFRESLRRVRAMALAAYDHQDYPFEKLVVELRPERDLSFSPVFQVLFSVGHVAAGAPDLPGLTLKQMDVDRGICKFDLTVGMTEVADGVNIGCEYSTDLFERRTVERLLDNFEALLEAVVANPDEPIARLPVVTAAERRQVLVEWNATEADVPDRCVHELIAEQAARTPDAVSVEFDQQPLTYRELDERANQLARYLRERGVAPGAFVGLCVERSLEMAVGILGILKAGGAYVPLDPTYPQERLAFMLGDAAVPVLLTQKRLTAPLAVQNATVVCLDTDWKVINNQPKAPLAERTDLQQLAYLIYTSGSTGQPRGVMVTHQGLVNHATWSVRQYELTRRDRVLQFSSLSFDIAVEEIFPTWLVGATLVLRAEAAGISGSRFLRWLNDRGVTLMDLPTAFWHEWVHELAVLEEPLPPSLRLVIVGGEKALAKTFATWRTIVGDHVRWLNTYGPTETTVVATVYEPPRDYDPNVELPIGRPIANTRVYLLDAGQQPVPIGVPGEMYIGGSGVARGYSNQPVLTAERFLHDPFARAPGARMYRTGDLARYNAGGNLEFLGRIDQQVKIRGYRIELDEIAGALCQHPGVRDALVIPCEDRAGQKWLVAYVVPTAEQQLSQEDLRSYLHEKLPEPMVPTQFIYLAAFPLTPNGKVDRTALPAPSREWQREGSHVAPRDPLEHQLVLLWEDLLARQPLGIRDNFFQLGGHSLLAVRLFMRIEKLFGKSLPLAALFKAPTIEQLAQLLRQDVDQLEWPTLVDIQPRGTQRPLFCVAAPGVNALGFAILARNLGTDQPLYVLQSRFRRQADEEGGLYTAEEYRALAEKYIAALRAVQPQGPYAFAGMCEGAHIAFEMALQLQRQDEPVEFLGILDAWPVENSKSYIGWYIYYYSRLWRQKLQSGPREVLQSAVRGLGWILRKAARLLDRRRRRGPNMYEQRVWPGKDFRPPRFAGRITVFRVRKQPYWRPRDYDLGWRLRAEGGVEIHIVPGGHADVLRDPNVTETAAKLTAALEQARAEPSVPLTDDVAEVVA